MISCGAALFSVRLALRSLGYIPETSVLPDPGQPTLVARVSWRERAATDEFERRLAGQLLTRRTHRGAFDPEPLPPDTLAALRAGAAREGAALRIVADDGHRAALAAVVQAAEHQLRRDGERLRELTRWTPAPGSASRDGVPATSYPARPEHTEPDFPGRDFARGHGWGLPPLSPATSHRAAGVAGLLTTAADRPADWVHAGPGPAADPAHRQRLRGGGGAAHPAAGTALAARVHQDPAQRRRLPAPRAPDRDGHPGGGQRAP